MKTLDTIIGTIATFFLTIFFMLLSVFCVVLNRDFYPKQFEKCNVAIDCKMSIQDVNKTMDVLLDYLENKRDDIYIIVEKDGEMRPAFYERETLHMIDVKVLYQRTKAVMYFSMAIFSACVLVLMYKNKNSYLGCVLPMKNGLKITGIIFVVFISVIIAMVAYDFNWFWVHFHYVFFDNDLWLLDPRYSTMINMLPEQLFFAMVVRIIIMFVALMGVFMLLLLQKNKFKN